MLKPAGATYGIAEPDVLAEIEHAAASVDWEKKFPAEKFEQAVRDYKPKDIAGDLPKASKTKTYLADQKFVLPFDIPDKDGNVIYPKGYTFNPLDYMEPLDGGWVVIDGSDPLQVRWLKKSEYIQDMRVDVLLTGGNWPEVERALGRVVYYLTKPLAERLGVRAVPSVVVQEGNAMRVTEIEVKEAGGKLGTR